MSIFSLSSITCLEKCFLVALSLLQAQLQERHWHFVSKDCNRCSSVILLPRAVNFRQYLKESGPILNRSVKPTKRISHASPSLTFWKFSCYWNVTVRLLPIWIWSYLVLISHLRLIALSLRSDLDIMLTGLSVVTIHANLIFKKIWQLYPKTLICT